MKNLLFVFFLIIAIAAAGQDTTYARSVMMKLGSPAFSGRGYVHGGIDSAARFIGNEFERLGLKPVTDSYFQPFNIEVNNFTSLELAIDRHHLVPGTDFILNAHSGSASGEFNAITIHEKIRSNPKKLNKTIPKIKDKILILNRYETKDKSALQWYDYVSLANPYKAAGIVVLDSGNLTYSVALYDKPFDHFTAQVAPHAFPAAAPKTVYCNIRNEFQADYKVNNLIAYLQGQQEADSFIVITAHYDHVGMLGDALYPGGNDNASGVAMMLDMARHLKSQTYRPKYSILFIALASEEAGLLGSTRFAEHPMVDLKKIKFLLNLDMVGTGSTGITVVNGTVFKEAFAKLSELNTQNSFIAQVKERGESCNSDHCPFYEKGVPSFFIYTTGSEYREYHSVNDLPASVPLTAYPGVFKLIEAFIYSF